MFRTLADKEIATLVVYGCSADDWKSVEVADGFNPNYVQNVHFSGKIRLGVFDKTFELPDGIRHCAGVYNCILHNCAIANNVYINKINNYIANCEIGEGAYIENVNLITTEGETSFGNGVRVAAVNENGKRSVPIFDKLSAQFAYIFAFYLHRPEMIERLTQLVYSYANTKKSSTGIIGKNVKIVNCGTIKNVKIGDNAEISGATSLENGSVNSSENALVAIANGVIMKNFIISSAAKITDFALLENCFVGQNCIVGKGFSAIDSLFFAHCEMFHGEAVSAFAAPFTVSHHKSSLLIAGAFLFANIGSGANQSNHGYRSGAVHQGVYGRGTKFGSNSYLLLPAETGIFTLVAGEHKNHLDTRLFPFSYLIGKCGESYLYPARNFVNAGTVRDIEKWKQRYKVTENEQLDFINFSLLNPFSIQKIQNGMFFMADRQKDFNGDFYEFGNCKISKNNFKNGIKTYAIALDIYLGNAVNERLKDINIENADALHARLQPDFEAGRGAWVDIAGLVAPKSEIDKLLDLIENGKINLEDIQQYFSDLHANFAKMEWTWIFYRLLEYFEKPLNEITAEDIKNQQTLFAIQQEKYQKLLDADAEKDFAENTKISYGVDCNEEEKKADFGNVRR